MAKIDEIKKEFIDRWSSSLYFTDYESQDEVKEDLISLLAEKLADREEEFEKNLETSAWAKAYKLMV